jgi:transposase-like protein
VLSEAERRILGNWARRRRTAQGLAFRARIVLACAEGRSNTAVAARLSVSRGTVTRWRARFLAARLDGLSDEPRPRGAAHDHRCHLRRRDGGFVRIGDCTATETLNSLGFRQVRVLQR